MVAQGPDLPIHLGSMPLAVKAVIQAWPTVQPGDVFIHNDPYFGGSHLPDVNVVTPAFHEGTLLGFACVRAHWPDIGSATPGSYGATTEIFGEGLRLPPVRLCAAGVPNLDVESIIFTNVRTPDERRGDLRAQMAANQRGVLRLQELARKHGAERLLAIMQEVMDYSERLMRGMLARLPDGTAVFEDFCDGDGIIEDGDKEDRTFRIRLQVTKQGDRLTVDFAGTDRQVPGPMNAPLAVTASGIYTAVKMIADPDDLAPPNSGCWRPIELRAEPGTVVNALAPAPVVYANHEISHRVCDMLFGAMAALAPDRVMACSQGTSAIATLGGVDYRTGERYVSYETIKGGFGARPIKDGITGVASGISNTMNTPIEILEMSFPVRVERYEIVPDTGGAGRWRGGCGVRARVAHPRRAQPGERVLRAHQVAALRPGRRPGRRARARGRRGAGRRGAGAEQQGDDHHRPGRRAVAARPGLRRLRRRPPSATPLACATTSSTATSPARPRWATTATPIPPISRAPRAARSGPTPVADRSASRSRERPIAEPSLRADGCRWYRRPGPARKPVLAALDRRSAVSGCPQR